MSLVTVPRLAAAEKHGKNKDFYCFISKKKNKHPNSKQKTVNNVGTLSLSTPEHQ